MKIALMLGHWGKPTRQRDRGAVGEVIEAHEALRYLTELAIALEKAGHNVVILAHGSYSSRQQYANKIGAKLFVACHLNAPSGSYGLILHDSRGKAAKNFAEILAGELENALGYRFVVKSVGPGGDQTRGFNNVRFTKMPAIILEPAFVNGETISVFKSKIDAFVSAFVRAVEKWGA